MTDNYLNEEGQRVLVFNGVAKSMSDWCREQNVSKDAVRKRLQAGWTVAQALTMRPVQRRHAIEGVFRWSEAQDNVLRHLYLFHRMGRKAIAAEMGFDDVTIVARRLARLRLVDLLTPAEFRRRQVETTDKLREISLQVREEKHGQFVWSEHRLSVARRMYVDELKLAPEIARALNCRPVDVSRKAHMMGWPSLRPPEFREAQRRATALANQAKGTAANIARAAAAKALRPPRQKKVAMPRPSAPRPSVPRPYIPPPTRAVSASDADLIAAAIAAGKITVLPPAIAPGLSRLEMEWGTPPPEKKAKNPWRSPGGTPRHKQLLAEAAARAASYATT